MQITLKNHFHIIVTLLLIFLFYCATHFLSLHKTTLLWLTDLAWTFAAGFIAWESWQLSNTLSGTNKRGVFLHTHIFHGLLAY